MTAESMGITLKGLSESLTTMGGEAINTLKDGKPVPLTRELALTTALEAYVDSKNEDKFKLFDLGLRLHKANGSLAITAAESVLAQAAVGKAWPQPGTYTQLCRWLEGE